MSDLLERMDDLRLLGEGRLYVDDQGYLHLVEPGRPATISFELTDGKVTQKLKEVSRK